jgi:hypothetical protein
MSAITVLLVVGCYVATRAFAIEVARAIRSRRDAPRVMSPRVPRATYAPVIAAAPPAAID